MLTRAQNFYFHTASLQSAIAAFVEPIVILTILIINAIVGVLQERDAENALEKLKELQPKHAKVTREGKLAQLDAAELVPGDIINVKQGDRIPADARVLQVGSLTLRYVLCMVWPSYYQTHHQTRAIFPVAWTKAPSLAKRQPPTKTKYR